MKPTIVQKTTNDLHSEVFKQGVHLIYFVTIVFIHIIKVGEHDVTSLQKSLQAIRCRVTDPKNDGFPDQILASAGLDCVHCDIAQRALVVLYTLFVSLLSICSLPAPKTSENKPAYILSHTMPLPCVLVIQCSTLSRVSRVSAFHHFLNSIFLSLGPPRGWPSPILKFKVSVPSQSSSGSARYYPVQFELSWICTLYSPV